MDAEGDHSAGMALRPGAFVLGRFRLERILGRGGMAVVWLAMDSVLEEWVALKFLPEVVVRDAHALALLAGEVKQARRLSHPNILRVHDLVMEEGVAAISMNWVDGSTLSELQATRKSGILEVEDLEPWLPQMLSALDYAHGEVKLVHRDLKPSNFMVDSRGRLFITDFAIARSLADTTTRLTNQEESGTLVYMSPQQLMGKNDRANDFYSLGATFYDLLTGMPPFWTGNVTEQILKVIPPSVEERRREFELEGKPIPPHWEAAIASCLNKEGEGRPQSGEDFMRIIEGRAQPRPAKKPPPVPKDASPSKSEEPAQVPPGPRPPEKKAPPPGARRSASGAAKGPRVPVPRPAVPSTPQVTPAGEGEKPMGDASQNLPSPGNSHLPPAAKRKHNSDFPWPHIIAAGLLVLLLLAFGWYLIQRTDGTTPLVSPFPVDPEKVIPKASDPAETAGEAEIAQPRRESHPEPITLPFDRVADMNLVWISPGSYFRRDLSAEDHEAVHQVVLSEGFWMGQTEVTQGQYFELMNDNPSHFQERSPEAPVERVDWFDAVEFCGRLTEREAEAGRLPEGYYYTLPTEAQWEYACRAGSPSAFATGSQLSSRQANFNGHFPYGGAPRGEFRQQPIPVGSFSPNAFGLYDMHGNVREWCLDWYGVYPEENLENPRGPLTGERRVVRGGSWFDSARFCRSGHRLQQEPYYRGDILGFRVVLVRRENHP